jgi:hypothetical protein
MTYTDNNSITARYLQNLDQIHDGVGGSNNPKSLTDTATVLGNESIPLAMKEIEQNLEKLRKSGSNNPKVLQAIQNLERTLTQLQNSQQNNLAQVEQMRKSSNEAITSVTETKQAIWKELIDSGAPMGGILLPEYKASVLGPVGSAWVTDVDPI